MKAAIFLSLPLPAYPFVFFAIAFLFIALLLLLFSLIGKIHNDALRKRAVRKASRISEGLGGNNSCYLHGDDIVSALKNKAITYVAFPLAEGPEILYKSPSDSTDPSLFIAGKSLVMALPLEDYDEKAPETLARIADGFNRALTNLYGKKGVYSPVFYVIANNASEASRVTNNSAKVVIGLAGFIKELLHLARSVGLYDGRDGLNALYAVYPDVRLLMKEDRECDPRIQKGKMLIDRKEETVLYDPKEEGDSLYSFHLYAGRSLQKPRKES
jgi:hypothetical protein